MSRYWLAFILVASSAFASGCKSPRVFRAPVNDDVVPTAMHTSPEYRNDQAIASQQFIAEPMSIEDYVDLGLSQNPRIAEAEHRIQALQHRIPQVNSLPNPTLNTTTYLSPIQTAAGEQTFALGVSQKIIRRDRRKTRADIVAEEIKAAEAGLLDLGLEIARDIRTACYQLEFIRDSIEITKEDTETLARLATVVEEQYKVKKSVSQQDVLNVHIEQSKAENNLTRLIQKEKSYRARLARLLHVASDSTLPMAKQPTEKPGNFDVHSLVATALQNRPDILAQVAQIQRDQKKIRLAELEKYPDFSVGLNWIATSDNGISPVANGDDALLLGFGFDLPIYRNRIQAGICEARENSKASAFKMESIKDAATEKIFDLVAQVESARETLQLVREDILPNSKSSFEIALKQYPLGEVDYIQLIENWRTLLRVRLLEKRIASELKQAWASLSREVGNFDTLQSIAAPAQADVAPERSGGK